MFRKVYVYNSLCSTVPQPLPSRNLQCGGDRAWWTDSRGKAVRGPSEGRVLLSVKEAWTTLKSVGSRGGELRAAWAEGSAEGGQAKPCESPLHTVWTWHSCGMSPVLVTPYSGKGPISWELKYHVEYHIYNFKVSYRICQATCLTCVTCLKHVLQHQKESMEYLIQCLDVSLYFEGSKQYKLEYLKCGNIAWHSSLIILNIQWNSYLQKSFYFFHLCYLPITHHLCKSYIILLSIKFIVLMYNTIDVFLLVYALIYGPLLTVSYVSICRN